MDLGGTEAPFSLLCIEWVVILVPAKQEYFCNLTSVYVLCVFVRFVTPQVISCYRHCNQLQV